MKLDVLASCAQEPRHLNDDIPNSGWQRFDSLGCNIVIPRRLRGASRRKKSDKSVIPNGTEASLLSSNRKSDTDTNVHISNSSGDSVKHAKIVSNHRKRRYSTSDKHAHFQKDDGYVDDSHEEESLEENAARMLSSRFSVHSQSFSADCDVLGSKESSGYEANRVLRPKRRIFKNVARRRRHFYEVHASNMDSYWAVKRRIRVFWPLDQIWYFGVVEDYNPVTGLHHVKYDDREEEWVDLQKERFKLLMFPIEFIGKEDFKKCNIDVKHKAEGGENVIEDDCESSFMESESKISWMVRSIHQAKPPSLNLLKRKRSHSNKHQKPPLLVHNEDHMDVCSSVVNSNEGTDSIASRLVFENINHGPLMNAEEDGADAKKHFHKKPKGNSNVFVENHADMDLIVTNGFQEVLEFDITSNTLKLNQGTPELTLSLPQIHKLLFPSESVWVSSTFLWFLFGKLMPLLPEIHLEVFFPDNIMGLKMVSCDGYLGHAVALVFLILKIFQQFVGRRKPIHDQQPFISIGFKFSALQNIGRCIFVAHCLFDLESSKWEYLIQLLEKQCNIRQKVSVSECTYASTTSLLEKSNMMPLPKIVDSTSLLGCHIKLSMKNEISSQNIQNHNHEKLINGDSFSADESSCLLDISSLIKSAEGSHSCLDAINYQEQQLAEVDSQLLGIEAKVAKIQETFRGMNPDSRRNDRHPDKHTPILHSFRSYPQVWPEGFGLVSASKKPRTPVLYQSNKKSQSSRKLGHPCKKARIYNTKKLTAFSRNSLRNLTSLICEADILVTEHDRGWRKHAAQVLLDSDDQDWRILVKVSGATKYSHKVHQSLQPTVTHQYTNAILWKGGKNWTLEFTDHGQWSLFREIHEECYNQNIKADSVKNIPIPGVRLIEDSSDYAADNSLAHSSPKYFQQVGTEVDFAMDPSCVLYDMDSDDERWVLQQSISFIGNGNKMAEISDTMFEKAIDMLENFAYAQQCDEFSDDEIESFMAKIGPAEAMKAIHEYWRSKRYDKGVPLIRQFQPPLWEQYQKRLKEWKKAVNAVSSRCNGERKGSLIKKPSMFAFCLKPPGLDAGAPNKGSTSKQRSHKKFTVSGQHSMFAREHDNLEGNMPMNGYHPMGYDNSNHESSDSSLLLRSPTRFPPSNSNYRKARWLSSFNGDDLYVMSKSSRCSYQCNSGYRESWNGRQTHQHAYIEVSRLHDAFDAAQHASNMAKLKRERAERLLHKADLAIHRARAAIMIAEATKPSKQF